MYEIIKIIEECNHYDITESLNIHLKEGWEIICSNVIKDDYETGSFRFIYIYTMGLPKDNNKQ